MKGRMRSLTMMIPLSAPTTRPATIPPSAPANIPYGSGLSIAATTLPNATVAPTDRSIPPVMMTKHMPRATSADMDCNAKPRKC